MTKSGIYIIKNTLNGKMYIGSAVNIEKRWYEHRWALDKNIHRNIHLQRAWNKDGGDSFVFNVYIYCDIPMLIFYEQLTIDAHIIRHGRENIYNISPTAGSSLGRKHSEETKRKIGEKSKGRWTGKHHTEETKEKIRIGNIGINVGRKHTAEVKHKMSMSKLGVRFTEEHKRNLGLSIKKYWERIRQHAN